MKTKYTLFRRGEMFYMQDSATGRQTSLRTKDETEAKGLLVGIPERFAQSALDHNSHAIHRAYAKKAQIIVPSLEEYEAKAALQLAKAN